MVGTGPAGSVAARYLAKSGVKVALVDKATLPRYKTCGGAVVGRALRLLPVDIAPVVLRECYRADMNLLDANVGFSCERQYPIVSMTMRDALDFHLAKAAAEAGASLLAPLEIRGLQVTDNCVLETSDGNLTAQLVVAADGATGLVSRAAGWRPNTNAIPALEYEVTVPAEVLDRFAVSARFDFGLVPHGYAWVFPKDYHLSVGVLSTRRGRTGLHTYVDHYLRQLGIDSVGSVQQHGYVIPVRPVAHTFVRNRTLLVGDAAGLVDPVTAEGISFAALSGRLAADAILQGELDEVRVRRLYHASLRKSILSELRAARLLARFLYNFPHLRNAVFKARGQLLAEAVTDVFMGDRTFRGAVMDAHSYVRLL